jgi:nucleoid-associated protein YgaU
MTRWMTMVLTAVGLIGSAAIAQTELEPTDEAPTVETRPSLQPSMPDAPSARMPAGEPIQEYVVEEGDTLTGIAAELLGSEAEWQRIADANGIDDPAKLRAGQRLAIPPKGS